MILPFDKFKQYCYLKNNTNKLNFEYYKTVTNCSKEIFDYFSNNVNFESWFNLMLANNINDDTKRLLFYAAYDNDVKKIDGIVNIDRDNIIKVLASYITTSGGNQIDKVNTENLAMINSKAIRIFDGQGAIALYQTQQYKQGNNKNIFITCASCIEDAVEFFKQ